uniref:COesterase domain-containing protein n=1 Tax=Heterorhabditis bacteriophora TaxID=37862 RepID=A0A1I7XK47_HETBA
MAIGLCKDLESIAYYTIAIFGNLPKGKMLSNGSWMPPKPTRARTNLNILVEEYVKQKAFAFRLNADYTTHSIACFNMAPFCGSYKVVYADVVTYHIGS